MPPINSNQPPPTTTPGQGLDTGTGGFPIDGKRNAYDVGSDVGDELPLPEWSSGQVKVDNAPQDLSDGTKRTLASYLSKTTLGETTSSPTSVKNSYPVTHNPSDQPDPVSLKDPAGYPTNPSASSNSTKYVAANTLSSRSDAATSLKMLRGRQLPNGESTVDGHDLLRQAAQEKPGRPKNPSAVDGTLPKIETTRLNENSPIKNYSNAVIFNRFNPEGNQYEQTGAGLTAFQFASKYEMGTSTADRDMSYGRLAQIGNALSIRAGLELTSTQEGNNPSGPGADAAALLPGAAQLGISRIDRNTLTAQSVLDDGLFDSIDTDLLTDPAGLSWGTMNNVLDQYAGVSNFGMQLLAIALVVALGVTLDLFTRLFSLGGVSQFTTTTPGQRRPYGASRYDGERLSGGGASEIIKLIRGQVSIWRVLGISPTLSDFNECLPEGALQFFGINANVENTAGLAAVVATEGLLPASQNPGFYAVMARSFNRSFLLLSDAFVSLAKAFGSGATAGIRQLFSLIDTIRSSRFIKFIDTFGQLGDLKLNSPKGENEERIENSFDESIKGPGKKFFTRLDSAPLNAAGKGRVGKGSLIQSKSALYAKDYLLLPNNIAKLTGDVLTNLNVPDFKGFTGNLARSSYKTDFEKRITPEAREAYEQALEAEYVPFYIHDVRTNEILSFHAFLTSLTDDYSASYDSSEAFGRVEAIKTYKGTSRKIGFSFILAASSEEDFDYMWTKINKLTTMVYPQFSEGRKLVSSDGKNALYAPFSQSIMAAPLVRVRIGDLIKSNYSKFNLARLFGFYYSDSVIDEYSPDGKLEKKKVKVPVKKKVYPPLQNFMVPGNTFVLAKDAVLGSPYLNDGQKTPLFKGKPDRTNPDLNLPDKTVLKIKETVVLEVVAINNDPNYYVCECMVGQGDDGPQTAEEQNLLKNFEATPGNKKGCIGRSYLIHSSFLKPTKETLKKIETGATEVDDETERDSTVTNSDGNKYGAKVSEFMDEDKGNAISRSFKSIGGKGLPGFIESLAFDWYDRVTWATGEGEGRTAPKMCKVTISFSPFHDITPGLDHVGFNRAPVYPVGPLNPRKKA